MQVKVTPENARFIIEQDIYDPCHPCGRLAITMHERDGLTVCNTWIFTGGKWKPLLPERLTPGKPCKKRMEEEIMRYGEKFGVEEHTSIHFVVLSVLHAIDDLFA